MPGLAITSFNECLYAEDAADNKTFCLFNISALQQLVHHMGQLITSHGATHLCKLRSSERTPFDV